MVKLTFIIITGYTIRLRTTTTENIDHFPEVKNVTWKKLICHIFALCLSQRVRGQIKEGHVALVESVWETGSTRTLSYLYVDAGKTLRGDPFMAIGSSSTKSR